MKKLKLILLPILLVLLLSTCKSVSNKIDEKTLLEEKQLSNWLNKSLVELKNYYGEPDKIDLLKSGNQNYTYITKKYNIKCVRKFEIAPNNQVTGFSSKNCF